MHYIYWKPRVVIYANFVSTGSTICGHNGNFQWHQRLQSRHHNNSPISVYCILKAALVVFVLCHNCFWFGPQITTKIFRFQAVWFSLQCRYDINVFFISIIKLSRKVMQVWPWTNGLYHTQCVKWMPSISIDSNLYRETIRIHSLIACRDMSQFTCLLTWASSDLITRTGLFGLGYIHDDVMTWKSFRHHWRRGMGIQRSPIDGFLSWKASNADLFYLSSL